MTTRMAKHTCPFCGKTHDAISGAGHDGTVPKEGDITMCVDCGAWSFFTADMQLRKPTDDEYGVLARNQTVIKASLSWQLMQMMGLKGDTKLH